MYACLLRLCVTSQLSRATLTCQFFVRTVLKLRERRESRGLNFFMIHRQNVDQTDMPDLICIAIGRSAFFGKKKFKTTSDPNFFLP